MKKIIFIITPLIPLALSAMTLEQAQDEINHMMAKDQTSLDFSADSPTMKDIESLDANELVVRSPEGNTVSINKINDYCTKFMYGKFGINVKKDQGTNKEQQALVDAVNKICTRIGRNLKNNNQSTISKKKLDFILNAAISSLSGSNEIYKPSHATVEKIDTIIRNLFSSEKLSIRLVPKEMTIEFAKRRKNIITTIQQLMEKRKTTTISDQEVEKIIHDSFDGFIDRMKHVLISNWIYASGSNIKQNEPGKPLCSSIPLNKEAKKLEETVTFFKK